ncbi:hypothetical protein [Sporisorium scitamineum]|nr:hypothetical protein [Sporisorium scitamineum]
MAGYTSNYISNQVHGFVGSHVPGGNQFFRELPEGGNNAGRESSASYGGGHRDEDSSSFDSRPSFPQAEPTGHDRYGSQEHSSYPGSGGYAPPGGPPPGPGAPQYGQSEYSQQGYGGPPQGYGQPQQHPPSGGYGQGNYNQGGYNQGGGYGGNYDGGY